MVNILQNATFIDRYTELDTAPYDQILSRGPVSGWLQDKFIQPYLLSSFFNCDNLYNSGQTYLCHLFTYMFTYGLYTCT